MGNKPRKPNYRERIYKLICFWGGAASVARADRLFDTKLYLAWIPLILSVWFIWRFLEESPLLDQPDPDQAVGETRP